jgi:hypothetical protein
MTQKPTEPSKFSRGKLSRVFNASASNKIGIWLSLFGIAGGLLLNSPDVIFLGFLGLGWSVLFNNRKAIGGLNETDADQQKPRTPTTRKP